MKKIINSALAAVLCLAVGLSMFGCSGSGSGSGDTSAASLNEIIASDNFNKINKQLDKAVAKGDFAFAFAVLNSIPSHFDHLSRFYYNPNTGEIGDYDSSEGIKERYTSTQYCRKAVSVLKAESDVLLSTNNAEAESLFLEHLADFDLGVNKVNIGIFEKYTDENHANETYQEAVTIYNDYLISVIRKALVKNNPALAKKIALLIRDGLSFKLDNHDYIWFYDTEAKDEANEIIENHDAD